jgi:flagellar export protein FliJ
MSFHFPLAAVLRYRESMEQREHLALERLQQEIARVEVRMRQIGEDRSTATQALLADLARGTCAAEVQAAYEYQRALEQQQEGLQTLSQELKKKWRQQLVTYELARRNRETMENLRQKQLDAYSREQAKREQAVIDDLFLMRRRRGR